VTRPQLGKAGEIHVSHPYSLTDMSLRCFVLRRYHRVLPRRDPPRPTVYSVAILLGTEARKDRSSAYALDGAAAHETVNVDSRSWSLRRHADYCMYQLGSFLLLAGLGAAVLPNIPQPDPDPHHAPHIAHVLLGCCGKRHYCTDHRTHRRRLHSWCAVSLR